MAVATFKEIHVGREGGDSFDAKYEADITRAFRCVTTSNYDGPGTVLDYSDCPKQGQQHSDYPDLYVSRRRAVNESNSKIIWIVTIVYKTSVIGKSENPLADAAEITWGTESETVPVFWDKNSHAILNSAGDYFIDGIQAEFATWSVKMKKNLTFVPQWLNSYRNAINSDTIMVDGVLLQPRQAKVSGIQVGQVEKRNGISFRSVEMSLKIKNSWVSHPLQQGLYELCAGVRRHCWDDNGKDVTSPVCLDSAGLKIPTATLSPSTAAFGTFYIYSELPFS